MPRKTRICPAPVSARNRSPFGAVRIRRVSFNPLANCSTLNPSGALGQAFAGRATRFGPLSADSVAKGFGRSCTMILCVRPGSSARKSTNGELDAAAGSLLLLAAAAAAVGAAADGAVASDFFAPPLLSDFTKLTICQRCCSGRLAHDGMPFSTLPVVMNQNTSPGVAVLVGPSTSDGTLPVPWAVCPWQEAQRFVNNSLPALMAAAPVCGFFIFFADAGA